jgi:hypothetical protein
MQFQAVLFRFLTARGVSSQYLSDRTSDGIADSVPGYTIACYSSRYEPLCGTIMTMPTTGQVGLGAQSWDLSLPSHPSS